MCGGVFCGGVVPVCGGGVFCGGVVPVCGGGVFCGGVVFVLAKTADSNGSLK